MARRNNKPTVFELEGRDVKPCPFCGGYEILMDADKAPKGKKGLLGMDLHWAECGSCGARGPERPGRRFAVKLWQKRDRPPSVPNKSA